MMSEWFLEAANHTCGNYDRGVNEIGLAGLTPMPSVRVGRFAEAEILQNAVTSLHYDSYSNLICPLLGLPAICGPGDL